MNDKRGIWSSVALSAALLGACGGEASKFDPSTIETVRGVVVAVDSFVRLERNTRSGVAAVIEDDDGKRTNAVLGPAMWLDEHGLVLERGDELTVTGSAVKDEKSGLPTIVATEVRKDNTRLQLRDGNGRPAWATFKLEPAKR